jgi:hypothetical protein
VSKKEESWDIPIEEFEWRIMRTVQTQKGPRGIYAAYPDARSVAKHLDRIFGAEGWEDDYYVIDEEKRKQGAVVCRLTVTIGDKQVTKTDVGHITDIEPYKGGFSDAFKRAAAKLGVGRNAYEIPEIWGPVEERQGKYYPPRNGPNGETLTEFLVAEAHKALKKATGPYGGVVTDIPPDEAPAADLEVPDSKWAEFVEAMQNLSNDSKEIVKDWWNQNGSGTSKPERDIDKETFKALMGQIREVAEKEAKETADNAEQLLEEELGATTVDDPF